jgi:hypothetical protein
MVIADAYYSVHRAGGCGFQVRHASDAGASGGAVDHP